MCVCEREIVCPNGSVRHTRFWSCSIQNPPCFARRTTPALTADAPLACSWLMIIPGPNRIGAPPADVSLRETDVNGSSPGNTTGIFHTKQKIMFGPVNDLIIVLLERC